jgi:hypothetical protein
MEFVNDLGDKHDSLLLNREMAGHTEWGLCATCTGNNDFASWQYREMAGHTKG